MSHPALSHINLLAISDAAPSRNGAGAYYQDLLEQMEGRLHQAVLYSPTIDDDGNWQAGLILPLPGDKTQKLCFPNIWKLNRLFNELKPQVVVIATPGVYGITGAWLARRKKIPYLTGMHTSFEQITDLYWGNTLQGKIIGNYFKFSNGFLFRYTQAVLGNAEPILEQARAMGAPDVKLIGTPISSEFINTPYKPYQGRLESCLFAGRLAKEKNIEEFLATVRDFPAIKFSVAGDGPLREAVAKAAQEYANLVYHGWLSRGDLRKAVDDHDAVLLPSHFETFGTIALEAMARERLILVSRGCGITHWERLLPGLIIIDDQGLSFSLGQLARKTPEQRKTIAQTANTLAMNWNNEVLNRWCHIITDTISDYSPDARKEN